MSVRSALAGLFVFCLAGGARALPVEVNLTAGESALTVDAAPGDLDISIFIEAASGFPVGAYSFAFTPSGDFGIGSVMNNPAGDLTGQLFSCDGAGPSGACAGATVVSFNNTLIPPLLTTDGLALVATISATGGVGGQLSVDGAFTNDDTFEDFPVAGVTVNVVPEPGTLVLLGVGLAGLSLLRRRARNPA